MYNSTNRYRNIFIGLFLLAGLFDFISGEFIISTLLFALVIRGSVFVITLAAEHDLKSNLR